MAGDTKKDLGMLPIEIIRSILFFCEVEEVVFVFPKISQRFYAACRDSHIIRSVIKRSLELERMTTSINGSFEPYDNHKKGKSTTRRILRCIDAAVILQVRPVDCWIKWAIATKSIISQEQDSNLDDTPDFKALLRLMQYLPHALLNGMPVCDDSHQRKWQMMLIAIYFFDVTGGPGYRSRLYVEGLNMPEINLRMAIVLTRFVLEMKDVPFLFERKEALGDQSIAGWLENAMIFSPDWRAISGRLPSGAKEPLNVRTLPFITVMFVATAVLHHLGRDERTLPDVCNIPLFLASDPAYWEQGASYNSTTLPSALIPVPFDIAMDRQAVHGDVVPSDNRLASFEAFLDSFHEKMLNDKLNEFFGGTWCIYYLVGQHCALRDVRFEDAVRGIPLKVSYKKLDCWGIESEPFEEIAGISLLTGTLQKARKAFSVTLQKTTEGDDIVTQLHGQSSPFGISGGYYKISQDGSTIPGGFFWLWKDQWAREVS